MATYQSQARKTIVAIGASSGLGFEVVRQLLVEKQFGKAYTVIIGARNVDRAMVAYAQVTPDNRRHRIVFWHVELKNLASVQEFAKKVVRTVPYGQLLDTLFLNAGMSAASGPATYNTKWCDTQVVNQLSQHYLMLLLRPTLEASRSRIVFVSSGAIKRGDPEQAHRILVYSQSKFTQLLNAHWWRRELAGTCTVVAVSPGLIPDTGIFRNYTGPNRPTMQSTDAKTVEEGAKSLLRAFTCTDMPEDPDRIFLTSWGAWGESSHIQHTLDKELQNKWSPSEKEIGTE
ncbi:hypothetical protein PG991_008850 [Apiospora marii]|uniref:Uncharacterized protein n=1 Tax=Apiospora marii TaxID=335849 RepID=A0ABR1RM62_9PEZI